FTNASVTGSTVYIRQGSAGGFAVTGTSSDSESGIDHLTFPGGLGSGWTGGGQDNSSPYTGVYTFSAAATAPGGGQDVTATNGSCGSFSGNWTTVTLTGGNDTTLLNGHCYEYREKLSDKVGNQGTSGTSNVAKIDNSAPGTPSLAFSSLSANAFYDGSGTLY